MKSDQAKLINYDYQAHVHYPRMSKEKRASIFLPYAALSGFNSKIQAVLKKHLIE